MTWPLGIDEIRQLVDERALEPVQPGGDLADHLLEEARQHLASAQVVLDVGDHTGAYQLAYDALRKTAVALLAVQGLRATSRGGHVAVERAVGAQFVVAVPAFASFRRLRRNRNRFEYPGSVSTGPSEDDVIDAITTADDALAQARILLGGGDLDRWI